MSRTTRGWAGLLIVTVLVVAGCSRSPEAQKARHLERGDKFAAREQHHDAILEHRNVLRLDPANARAIRQLGLSHYALGEGATAFRYLLKAQQLNPDDHEVRLKLGRLYLVVGKREEAREEAGAILSKEPNNLDALALLADAATSPQEVDDAIGLLERQRATLGDRAKFYLAIGVLHLRKPDLPAAERAFREAVAREPKSLEAHSLLGSLYLAKRDVAQAEREFKVAADLAPIGSAARLKLVDFYLSAKRPDEAKRILSEITQKAPDFLPAWRRLAQIALAERKYDESLSALKPILKKNPSDLDGHFLQGRVRLARRETTEAIQEFQQVLKLEPRHTPAHYELAVAHVQAGNLQQAKAALKEATSIAPNFVEATLLLADLNLQSGAVQPAIEDLEKFVALAAQHASASQPGVLHAHRLLGAAYLVKGEPVKATEAFRKIVALAPKDPRGPHLVGMGLRAQGKSAQAKQEFEAAIALAPAYVEPLTQLVDMALREKQPDAALNRVTKQIGLAPNSGGLQQLLGKLYLVRRETRLAEGAFLKAIELEPRQIEPYVRLGNLYRESGRHDEALAKLEEAVKVQPRNIWAQMLLAVLYEGKGEIAKAQQGYERILALNPRFAPAANNLAWLYAEHGGDKEKALQLAQTAKEILPEDPSVSDTLGWILYQRGVYERAASLLKESAGKLPDNPVIQYHLGLASLKVGDKEGARKALTAALNSPGSFAGKEEAKRALSELK